MVTKCYLGLSRGPTTDLGHQGRHRQTRAAIGVTITILHTLMTVYICLGIDSFPPQTYSRVPKRRENLTLSQVGLQRTHGQVLTACHGAGCNASANIPLCKALNATRPSPALDHFILHFPGDFVNKHLHCQAAELSASSSLHASQHFLSHLSETLELSTQQSGEIST